MSLLIFFMIFFLVGASLGLRFRVFVLIPATFASLIIAGSVSLAYGYDFQSFVITMVLSAIGLQIGYLAMTGARGLFAVAGTTISLNLAESVSCIL